MRRTLFLAAALALFAASLAYAQADPSASVMVIPSTNFHGCPVGFSAGHSQSLTQLRAQDARPGIPSQALNVRMDNFTRHDIVSAQITVHGFSPRHRIAPANVVDARGDLTKQVQLDLSVNAGRYGDTDVRVYGFTSVQRVDLDSLTYADGSAWTASSEHRCSIAPNGMMLVAAAP